MMSQPGLTILWALVLAILCHAGPINRQAGGHNTLRPGIRNQSYTEQNVCVSDDVLYQPGDLMPAPTPCSRCVCSPPGGLCMPVACDKKPGCKALQRPNQCCPEYQCECERNGRLYANGERLDNADNPCQACYCQGGEVVCTTVECYRRDDCEPQFVQGRCCPKYDHCPPLVMDDSRYGEPFLGGDRPQHTRATFQPNGGLEGETDPADPAEDDQALGASNVQERVHLPQAAVVATATTTAAPATDAPATAATEATAVETDGPAGTNAPATNPPQHDTPRDAAIKIDVPAVPWTETPEPTATDATTQALEQTNEEGSGATEGEALVKKIDEPVIGVIERIHLEGETNPEGVDEIATSATTAGMDVAKDDTTEAQTEQEPITRLFMLSKEAELDPTTVSTEYTDIPEEMSTLPETTPPAKETTLTAQGLDLSTEALLEATTTKESAPQASTDSSPEFKDFDEWSASKSSEFLRDSTSIGSSGGSSSGSGAHSKPAGSSSDESRSQILATNINTETVKLSSDQGSVPHFEGSSSDSTESAESTEESSTTEIVSSTENHNAAKTDKNKEDISGTKLDESESKEETPLLLKINEEQSNDNAKYEEKNQAESSQKDKRQPDIVLDTEATDENGPPILLIGDELANHQMDIVVATSSTEEAETETPSVKEKPEILLNQQPSTDQPTEVSDVARDSATEESTVTTEQPQEQAKENSEVAQRTSIEAGVPEDPRTEEPGSATDASATDDALDEQAHTEAGSGDGTKDEGSSTEKLDVATVAEEMMMSDDPLPGQAASAETAQRDENFDFLGKTVVKKEDSVDTQSATELTTLSIDSATEDPVEVRLGDLKTESPERESTTYAAKEDEGTTLESKYESITVSEDNNLDAKQEENDQIEEKVVERRADMPEQLVKEEATTEGAEENPTTTESSNTEGTNAENNEPMELADGISIPNEEKAELVKEGADVRVQSPENVKQPETEVKGNQSPKEPPKDTTPVVADVTDVPTTQNPEKVRASNADIFEEDVMLGDQPQSSLPATRLQTIESKEQKKEDIKEQKKEDIKEQKKEDIKEQKKEEEELKKEMEEKIEQSTDNTITESVTDKIQTNQPEQTTEIKERVIGGETSESTPKPETDLLTDSDQTTVLEQNTESVKMSESDKPQEQKSEAEKNVALKNKDDLEQKSEVKPEQQQQEKEVEPSQILVDSAKIPEQDEVAVRSGLEQQMSSDELSTPPPDTTSSDDKIQDETITSLPAKSADSEEIPSTVSPVDATTNAPLEEQGTEHTDMGVKINPEVLELKPPATQPPAASNASEATTFEPDSSTLSPEWLKSENASKEVSPQGDKVQEQQQTNEEEEDEAAAAAAAVTEHQAPPAGDAAGDADGGEQQRVERRVDETDKKDLFLLEDFFTKLYRHQIATDANKER